MLAEIPLCNAATLILFGCAMASCVVRAIYFGATPPRMPLDEWLDRNLR